MRGVREEVGRLWIVVQYIAVTGGVVIEVGEERVERVVNSGVA